jgi:hypothetical protein
VHCHLVPAGTPLPEVARVECHGSRTSIERVKWAIMPGDSTGPR